MTAQQLIDLAKPALSNLSVKDDDNTLLGFLNLAKNQIALDTNLWIDGEEITMTTAKVYTLSTPPNLIIDIYDSNLIVRPRNSAEYYGYYKTSPQTISINNPSDGVVLYVNYYYTPNDYALGDTVDVPFSLINAIKYFIQHQALESNRTQESLIDSEKKLEKYERIISKYLASVDENLDTVQYTDMITEKGLV